MALGSFGHSKGESEFAQRIEYNAKAGRMFRVDRFDSGNGFENDKVEITEGFSALMDLENIEIGWVHFPLGTAPDVHMARLGEAIPSQPSKDHKAGVRIKMVLSSQSAGQSERVRELMSSAGALRSAIDALHDAYLASAPANGGKLPIVSMPRVVPVQGKHGTNYQPEFVITGWADRPATLKPAVAAAPTRSAGPPPTGTTQKAPPPPAALDDDDFG